MRNKIKAGVLTETQVQQVFKVLPVVVMEYSAPLLEIASTLLKSYEQVVADFGILLYEAAFVHFNFYLKQNVVCIFDSEIAVTVGLASVWEILKNNI